MAGMCGNRTHLGRGRPTAGFEVPGAHQDPYTPARRATGGPPPRDNMTRTPARVKRAERDQFPTRATISISTRASTGNPATATQLRAGRSSPKNSA